MLKLKIANVNSPTMLARCDDCKAKEENGVGENSSDEASACKNCPNISVEEADDVTAGVTLYGIGSTLRLKHELSTSVSKLRRQHSTISDHSSSFAN